MKTGSLYFVSDKAIHDALIQHKFTKSDVRSIFLDRGIIVSPETPRDDVAEYFSLLNHDYYDHQRIADAFSVAHRKEKTSVTSIRGDSVSRENVENNLRSLCSDISRQGDTASVVVHEGFIEVVLKYQEVDFNKTDFKQVSNRESVISIEFDESGFVMRWPDLPYVEDVKNKIVSSASDFVDGDAEVSEIDLSAVPVDSDASVFFTRLMKEVEGFSFYDLIDVYLFNPPSNGNDGHGDEVRIDKGSLKGRGVLLSKELSDLMGRGFYISRVIWQATRNDADGSLYQFEAKFSNPEMKSRFSYAVHGYYSKKGDGDYVKTKVSCSSGEERSIGRLIEHAANSVADSILSPLGGQDG